jgi:hypothetical protein
MTVILSKEQEKKIIEMARGIAKELQGMSTEELISRINKIDVNIVKENNKINIDELILKIKNGRMER